ncbi:MAG: hypothetical protein WCO69_02770 [Candidatus Omnitrophota bacterium]
MSWLPLLPFVFLPFYWAYLLLNTQPVIIFDAVAYDELGRQIVNHGWGAYFHTLNREPLFPYLIACAMELSKTFGPLYHFFLKGILFVFLAMTLFGIYRLTRLLGAGRVAAGIGAFYAGISPAILNSTLWLWSEAAALPWAVWGLFFFIKAWRSAKTGRGLRRVAAFALSSALLFIGLLMVKAVVSAVVVLFGLSLLVTAVSFFVRRDTSRALAFVVAAAVFLGVFTAAVEGYKAFNYQHNGNYALTTRFHWALYGNTARRMQPLSPDRISQAVLSVPRLGFCERYYGQACVFWSFQTSDEISNQANAYCRARGFSEAQQRKILMDSSFKMMSQQPLQEALLSVLEGAKMLFWENRVFFVHYPPVLSALYSQDLFVYTLCFGWAFFGLLALAFAFTRRYSEYVLTAGFLLFFMGVHSIFFIDIRYALPVAPLFIVLVAAMFGRTAPRQLEQD